MEPLQLFCMNNEIKLETMTSVEAWPLQSKKVAAKTKIY
jgi:hypothetical protein